MICDSRSSKLRLRSCDLALELEFALPFRSGLGDRRSSLTRGGVSSRRSSFTSILKPKKYWQRALGHVTYFRSHVAYRVLKEFPREKGSASSVMRSSLTLGGLGVKWSMGSSREFRFARSRDRGKSVQ